MEQLTENEIADAAEFLQEMGFEEMDPEKAVKDALEAYVQGEANEHAKGLLRSAGFELIGDGIWSKVKAQVEENHGGTRKRIENLDPDTARKILKLGKEADLYPNDPPDDAEECIDEANEVVDLAIQYVAEGNETKDLQTIIEYGWTPYRGSFSDELAIVPFEGYDALSVTKLKLQIFAGDHDARLDSIEAYEDTLTRPRKLIKKYVAQRKDALEKEHRQTQDEKEPPREEALEREAKDAAPQLSDSGAEERPERSEESGEDYSLEDRRVDDEEYDNLVADAEREVKAHMLHIPPDPETVEDLPYDLTELTDKALHRAYGSYSANAYRVNYLLMLEEAKQRRVDQSVKELRNSLVLEVDKYDEQNHQRTIQTINAEIENNFHMKIWLTRQSILAANVEAFRSQRDGLYKMVDMLSRLETMRHQEAERSGRK